jgi:hypothetical protein
MWADVNSDDLLRLVHKDNCIYEVIDQFPHKVYFDIDADNKDYDIYEKIIPKLNELFPNSEMAVSGSKSEVRQSYHIVLNNYLIKNEEDRNFMKSLVKYFKQTIDDGFDDRVYTKNRFMKCINQSKEDGRIQAIVLNDIPNKHLITTFINESVLDMPNFAITQPEVKLALDIILSFSDRPLKFAIYFGTFMALLAIIISVWIVWGALNDEFVVLGWASLMASIFFVGGSILIVLGILGTYLGRVFNEVKNRPLYVISDEI